MENRPPRAHSEPRTTHRPTRQSTDGATAAFVSPFTDHEYPLERLTLLPLATRRTAETEGGGIEGDGSRGAGMDGVTDDDSRVRSLEKPPLGSDDLREERDAGGQIALQNGADMGSCAIGKTAVDSIPGHQTAVDSIPEHQTDSAYSSTGNKTTVHPVPGHQTDSAHSTTTGITNTIQNGSMMNRPRGLFGTEPSRSSFQLLATPDRPEMQSTPRDSMQNNPQMQSTPRDYSTPRSTDRPLSAVSRLSYAPSAISTSDGHSENRMRRSMISSSVFATPRPQSPYRGATGPSHPYAMYAQDIGISRTPSMATNSVVVPTHAAYNGPRRPMQQYDRYAQNTTDTRDGAESLMHSSIPANGETYPPGARPAPAPSQRRLGPEGEELADLIGPGGFPEQLPPYTRYANDIPPKQDPDASNNIIRQPSLVLADSTHDASRQGSIQPTDDSAGTTIASSSVPAITTGVSDPSTLHQNPFTPSHSASPSQSQPPRDPFADSLTMIDSSSPSPPTTPTEKPVGLKKRARSRFTRRVCSGLVPCWLLVVMILIVCLAVVFGAVMGSLLAKARNNNNNNNRRPPPPLPSAAGVHTTTSDSIEVVTSTYAAQSPDDGTSVPIPPTMPDIPSGTFAVPLVTPSSTNNACLSDPSQTNAWDCANYAHIAVVVNMPSASGGAQAPAISVTYPRPTGLSVRYGAQPPQLNAFSNLILMKDRAAIDRGLAYAFGQPYNKTVILRENEFPLTQNGKRGIESGDEGAVSASQIQDLSKRQHSSWAQTSFARPGDRPWYCFWNGTILEGFIYVSNNATAGNSTSASNPTTTTTTAPARLHRRQDSSLLQPTPTTTSTTIAPAHVHRRQDPISPQASLPPYPRPIKLEERRPPHVHVDPYCQQFSVLDDFSLGVITKDDGSPKIVPIQEHENITAPGLGGSSASWGNGMGGHLMQRESKRDEMVEKRVVGGINMESSCMCSWDIPT